ncbi:hypothetical protein R80B4_02249 [Fibrobacteres bacterium R8-0-B4]
MSYIGIGYSGARKGFLTDLVRENKAWLSGDRNPRFFGDSFLVMYDSNTAREFAKKCADADRDGGIAVYHLERAIKG